MLSVLNRRFLGLPLWLFVGIGLVLGAVITLAIVVGFFNLIGEGGYNNPVICSESVGCSFWHPIIYSAIVLFVFITGFAYTTLLERKFIAWFQQRVGPNRAGPSGLLQPLADAIKLFFKEDIEPVKADKLVYRLAPILKAVPVLIVIAVIPLGPPLVIPWFDGNWYEVPLYIADPTVGILWLLAVTSIATYGVTLAG